MAFAIAVASLAVLSTLLGSWVLIFDENPVRRDGYILDSRVTHHRLLPKESTHAFTYPTLALLLSLNALESHSLNLARGWVFGYGGLFFRLTGVRPSAYLIDTPGHTCSIKAKLLDVLSHRGYDAILFRDAWMMTMPSYLGFEGINPLTVYFCYGHHEGLWLLVLEVHNTFGERHVYILETGKAEDVQLAPGFHHQWTFPRQFHVSPFNDRRGFYTVSVIVPSHSPTSIPRRSDSELELALACPVVRIHLHSPDDNSKATPGPLKLTALLRAKQAVPLTTRNLLSALARRPFLLMLSMVRIIYHAWILHYKKRLNIYVRPDPRPGISDWGGSAESTGKSVEISNGGVGWQKENFFERYAREQVEKYLSRRVDELGIAVTLVAANPSIMRHHFNKSTMKKPEDTSSGEESSAHLTIWYLSPQFFTILFIAPSAAHALLLGYTTEQLFIPSSSELFTAVFSTSEGRVSSDVPINTSLAIGQRLRTSPIPHELLQAPGYAVPSLHPLDSSASPIRTVANVAAIYTSLTLGHFEEWVYRLIGTRFIKGQEPWNRWQRAILQHMRTNRDA